MTPKTLVAAMAATLLLSGVACAQDSASQPGAASTPAQAARAHVPMRQRFAELDSNHDGALTVAEIGDRAPHFARHFQQLDLDGDGKLTREELRQGKLARHAQKLARQQGEPPPQQ